MRKCSHLRGGFHLIRRHERRRNATLLAAWSGAELRTPAMRVARADINRLLRSRVSRNGDVRFDSWRSRVSCAPQISSSSGRRQIRPCADRRAQCSRSGVEPSRTGSVLRFTQRTSPSRRHGCVDPVTSLLAENDTDLSPVGDASTSHIQVLDVRDSVVEPPETNVLARFSRRKIGEFS